MIVKIKKSGVYKRIISGTHETYNFFSKKEEKEKEN